MTDAQLFIKMERHLKEDARRRIDYWGGLAYRKRDREAYYEALNKTEGK